MDYRLSPTYRDKNNPSNIIMPDVGGECDAYKGGVVVVVVVSGITVRPRHRAVRFAPS